MVVVVVEEEMREAEEVFFQRMEGGLGGRTAQTPAVARMIASRRITFTFSFSSPRRRVEAVVSHPRDHDFIGS